MINFLKRKLRKIDFLRKFYLSHLKKFDGKVRIYLTLKCNLKCTYCVNEFLGQKKEFSIVKGNEWIKAINREGRDVVLTGGEPTLHPDFIEIVNGIDSKLHVQVYTNLKWDEKFLKKYIKEIKRPVELYVSYHPSSGKPEQLIRVINELKKHNKFNGSVHAIKYKRYTPFLNGIIPIFKKNGINLELDEDQYDVYNFSAKKFKEKVRCFKKLILIAPDGYRYQCISKMIRGIDPLENFIKNRIVNEELNSVCHGYCAPCDGLGEIKFKPIK